MQGEEIYPTFIEVTEHSLVAGQSLSDRYLILLQIFIIIIIIYIVIC